MKRNRLDESIKPAVSLKTQYWLFTKRKTNLLLLVVFFIAGLYGLYQGFAFKSRQLATIEAFREEKATSLNELVKGFDADTTKLEGKAAYKRVTGLLSSNFNIVLPAFKTPSGTAIFSIGQADVFPYYYTVKTESFFMQLFKQGEITNPLRSLSGHFDMSFWIIYLLPLLIILLCFNTLSAELDNGNWRLINSQGTSARHWLSSKFLLVGLLVQMLVTAIFIGGLAINLVYFEQAPSLNDFLFFIGSNLYLLLWLSLTYAINAIGKSTSANALYSGVVWVAACIIMPALITMGIEKVLPVDNTTVSRMSRRPQGEKFENDGFGIQTIRQMGKAYPQYENATINSKSPAFRFAVYLAYHKLMDDTNSVEVKKYFSQIEKRQTFTNLSGLVNPTAAADGIFTSLAGNDAYANHQFVWQTKAFHAKLHEAYYPPLFFSRQLSKSDYTKFPVFKYTRVGVSMIVIINYLMMLVVAMCLFNGSNRWLKRRQY